MEICHIQSVVREAALLTRRRWFDSDPQHLADLCARSRLREAGLPLPEFKLASPPFTHADGVEQCEGRHCGHHAQEMATYEAEARLGLHRSRHGPRPGGLASVISRK